MLSTKSNPERILKDYRVIQKSVLVKHLEESTNSNSPFDTFSKPLLSDEAVSEHLSEEISSQLGTSESLTIEVEYLSDSSTSSDQNLSPISQILVVLNMAAPVNPMNAIIAAGYEPLVLPQVLHDLPTNYYLKYLLKSNGEGEVTAEEHLTTFYGFADNLGIEHEYVWMRLFAQSLDGEVRKWFRALIVNSIRNILELDAIFLRKWGEKC